MVGASELLALWERTRGRSLVEQALVLLDGAELPLGAANRLLLRRYQASFGDRLDLYAACPACGEELEVAVAISELLAAEAVEAAAEPEIALASGGLTTRLRRPGFADLASVAELAPAEAEAALLARCLVAAEHEGAAVAAADLDTGAREAIAMALAAADPLAEILLSLTCPACEHGWQALVEPAQCLVRQIEAAAHRLLREVDALAHSYGWSEGEILALSAPRRQAYLAMVTA